MEEEEEEEEDQGGKEDDGKSTRDSKRDGGVESNRAALGFRSDRAAKTNRRAFCSRFVAVAIPSMSDRQLIGYGRSNCLDQIVTFTDHEMLHIRFSAFWHLIYSMALKYSSN